MEDKVSRDRVEKVVFLHRNKLNLSHIQLLRNPEYFKELEGFQPLNHLKRGGYVYENEVTQKGKDLLKSFLEVEYQDKFSVRGKVQVVKGLYTNEFEEFWKEFPSTDTFTYGGKSFLGTRSFKVDKHKCQNRYNELLKEYSHQEVMQALKVIISIYKNRSIKEGKNSMNFFPNSYSYLNRVDIKTYSGMEELPEPQEEKVDTGFV